MFVLCTNLPSAVVCSDSCSKIGGFRLVMLLKVLHHGLCILKKLAKFFKFIICNPCNHPCSLLV